jgi:anhydro-N-acetylmuramic acid kinase
MQIAMALPPKKLFITGGGTMRSKDTISLPKKITIPPAEILNQESVDFALLGVLKLRQEINVLSSVTGALRTTALGYLSK